MYCLHARKLLTLVWFCEYDWHPHWWIEPLRELSLALITQVISDAVDCQHSDDSVQTSALPCQVSARRATIVLTEEPFKQEKKPFIFLPTTFLPWYKPTVSSSPGTSDSAQIQPALSFVLQMHGHLPQFSCLVAVSLCYNVFESGNVNPDFFHTYHPVLLSEGKSTGQANLV